MIALLLALLLAAEPVQVQAVVEDGRTGVRVQAQDLGDVSVIRAGAVLHVCLGNIGDVEVVAASGIAPDLTVDRAECGSRLTVAAAEDLPYEVRRSPGELLLLLGEEPLPGPGPAESTDLEALATQLWPGREPPDAVEEPAGLEEEERLVLRVGPLELRPLLSLFVGAQSASLEDTPTPSRYGWLILEPGLRGGASLLDGRLQLQYRPTFRRWQNTSFDGRTSHHYDGRLALDVLPLVRLEAHAEHARGQLESREVDPGYEYFFALRPFRRTSAGVLLGVDRGGMADIDLSLDWARTDLLPGSIYFDNDQWSARAAVRRDIGSDRAVSLYYRIGWADRVPERPVAQSDVREFGFELSGQISPMLPITLTMGRQQRTHDLAPGASESFTGLVAQATARREFARGLTLDATGFRNTYLSGFEENGYYVSKGGRVTFSGGLPLDLRFALGGGLQFNDYPLDATAIGVPRRDRVRSLAIGLSRTVRESFFLRLDYQIERRLSNIPGFSNRTGGFVFGVGISRRKDLL